MSQTYRAVQWTRDKQRYDALLGLGVLLSIASFVATGAILFPSLTAETLVIRAVGTTAFVLLHLILAIGPLCRLDPRFLPLLANRRHLGVSTAGLALVHGGFALFQFHALGDLPPLVSVLVTDANTTGDLARFPFQPFGLAALILLVVLAATSHDFWLANLTAPVWKAIHMAVYVAYGLLVAHVALGILQSETSPFPAALLGLGIATLGFLHLAAARREARIDRDPASTSDEDPDWLFACRLDAVPVDRARIVRVAGERVAIFRHGNRLSALSNVCQHQNGPLGEGRIEAGCVVCPWHGYQYDPASGRAPAPFEERVPTFDLRLEGDRIFVHRRPNPAGTHVEPIVIPAVHASARAVAEEAPASRARFLAPRVAAMLIGGPLLLGAIAASQREPVPSLFEFGQEREFVGWIGERPIPTLSILRPGDPGSCGSTSILPLVERGKRGAMGAVHGLDGRQVRLRGTLAHVDGEALIELGPEPIEPIGDPGAARPAARVESLGHHRLVGEIVDSKCHFGVMNPGTGKVHAACAARCLSGGIPPAFLVRDPAGQRAVLLLVDRDGRSVGRAVLARVGRPLTVEGEIVRHDDLLVFQIDPAAIEEVR